MSGRFADRVCLVTGSTGIAAAAAAGLAAEGGAVLVVSRDAVHARGLAEKIGASGGTAGWHACDLATEAGADGAIAACVARFGRLDACYDVAGISGRRHGDGPLHEMTVAGWEATMAGNATSTALVLRAAIRQLLAQDRHPDGQRGAILTMSSVLASSPSPAHFGTHAYTASKGAIEALSRAAAAHYAGDGIRVNVIAPALVATPMSERAQRDPDILAYLVSKQPLAGGPIDVEALTGTALYLLSDDARMVTGQVIAVDAGWSVTEA